MPANNRYKLQVRFGDDLLEAGFTAVPNLFLINYGDLGISDGAAFWIVHLLRFKWTEDNPYPRRSSIPINASQKTQIRYARELRKLGFLFSRRKHWSKEDNPPDPDLVGRVRALEYDFTSLFYNVVRISHWKAEGKPLDKFEVEIPYEIVEKVTSGYFHDVPQQWQQLCEQIVEADQNKPTDQPTQNGQVGDPESQPTQNGQVETEDQPTQNGQVDPQDQPTQIGQVDQPTQNDPLYNKDSLYKEEPEEEKEKQQQNTWPPAAAVVVTSLDELHDLPLQDDQVIVTLGNNSANFAAVPIFEVVRRELRRRRSEPFYEVETYYSVQHALGEGPDDWTDEELARIRRKQALERELGQRYVRIGAFSLEEALHQYFTPQFTTEILKDKAASELARIEDCVAYVRQQKNLTNPAGLLRILIESGEIPPLVQSETSDDDSPFPVTPVGRRLPGQESDEEASAGKTRPDRAPDLEIPDSEVTSRQLWDAALGELQLQMPRTTFDTWLKSTYIARIEEDNFTIRCANPYAKDWLENRLNPKITRTLAGILGRPVTVEYEDAT